MSIQTEQQHASQVIGELYQNTFFQRYWRAIGRFIGRGKQISIWVSAAIVMGANLLLGVTVSALLGETQFTTLKAILVDFMWVTYTYLLIPPLYSINTRMVEFLRLRFVNSLQDERHIHKLLRWARQWLGSRIAQFLVSFGFSIVTAVLAFYSIYPSTKFSVGPTLIYSINFFHWGLGTYSLLSLLAFVSILHDLHLALYPDDPASSPILLQLSKQLRDYVLGFAFSSAGLLLLAGLVGALNIMVILIMLAIVWIPMLTIFFRGNQALSQQIVRVKHERLEKLQFEITQLADGKEMDKDTIAHITSLMDYHDRVKSTRNSLYSPESLLNLLGSLALPLLAAILSAIDVWQRIFGRP